MAYDCDVLVVGGGPAGSTAAAWLARGFEPSHLESVVQCVGEPDHAEG